MDQSYFASLYFVDKHMKQQFAEPDERQRPERPEPVRISRTTRIRARVSAALYNLASSLNPELPVPARTASNR